MADDQNNNDSRLEFLTDTSERRGNSSKAYTRFIRFLRLALPLIAVCIIAILFAWPRIENMTTPEPVATAMPETPGTNELLNPRFESRDKKDQPFTITAVRAVQSTRDPEVVLLEKPMADITLNDASWVATEANKGTYNQTGDQLYLEGKVKLFHDSGYEMHTEKVLVDLKKRGAWSDTAVYGQGPAGTIKATGLQASINDGTIIFTGPAKLVLNRTIEGL